MPYFNLTCCTPAVSKTILLVLNALVAAWGAAHIGYAGSYSVIKKLGLDLLAPSASTITGAKDIRQLKLLTDGPLAYYVVAGVFALLAGVAAILLLLEVLGKQNRMFYFKLIAGLLMLNFAFEFAAAAYASLMVSYYAHLFESIIVLTPEAINSSTLLTQPVKDYYLAILSHYNFSMAEAVITWVVAVPCIAITGFGLIGQFVNENVVSEPTKVAPAKIQLQQKTQVQSFGVDQSLEFVDFKK